MLISEMYDVFERDSGGERAESSNETYRYAIKRFLGYLDAVGVKAEHGISRLTVDHALDFAAWCAGKNKLSPATLHVYYSAVATLYGWLIEKGHLTVNASDLQRLKSAWKKYRRSKASKLPKLPSHDAVGALVKQSRGVEKQKSRRLELARLRNIAMIEVLRCSGMRVGEMVMIRLRDLNREKHEVVVTGKGDKERVCYFDDLAWTAIHNYLDARELKSNGNLPLFSRHDRRASTNVLPMTTDSVRNVFKDMRESSRLEFPLTPHSLRHRFATDMLESAQDITIVQKMLGHSDPGTTEIYAQVSPIRIRKAYRDAFGE